MPQTRLNANPNPPALGWTLSSLGGSTLSTRQGRKHLMVEVSTARGARFLLAMSHSKIEPHKLVGWIQQRYRQADANHATNNGAIRRQP